MAASNPYLPDLATVIEVIEETPNIRSFKVLLNDAEKMSSFASSPARSPSFPSSASANRPSS